MLSGSEAAVGSPVQQGGLRVLGRDGQAAAAS